MTSWALEPTTYTCPLHNVDLTSEVTLEVNHDGPVVYLDRPEDFDLDGGQGGDRNSLLAQHLERDNLLSLWGRPQRAWFAVTVTCPGAGAEPKDHRQSFQGIRTPS